MLNSWTILLLSTANLVRAIMQIRPNRTQNDIQSSRLKRSASYSLDDFCDKDRVLYLDENFCVVNKPYDVRMDGEFDLTVEKLVSKWLDDRPIKDSRWIHQLDFATSGVLCVGMNKDATALACSAFERRDVAKEYIAVLQGKLDATIWPVHDHVPKENKPDQALSRKRKIESVDEPNNTSDWQEEIMRMNLDLAWQAFSAIDFNNNEQVAKIYNDPKLSDYHQIHTKVQSREDLEKKFKMRKLLRKFLKLCDIQVDYLPSDFIEFQKYKNTLSETATGGNLVLDNSNNNSNDNSNDRSMSRLSEQELQTLIKSYITLTDDQQRPFIYRPRYFHKESNQEEIPSNKLIITIPVAEIPGDFRMEPGHPRNPGKECQTELTILGYCTYKEMPVTKVLLKPHTGRRHQLRIHTMCLQHPIVGDFTYNQVHRDLIFQYFRRYQQENNSDSTSSEERLLEELGEEGVNHFLDTAFKHNRDRNSSQYTRNEFYDRVADRMMLHAHRLRIHFPVPGKCSWKMRNFLEKKHGKKLDKSIVLIDSEAPDPFLIDSEGNLQPVLHASI